MSSSSFDSTAKVQQSCTLLLILAVHTFVLTFGITVVAQPQLRIEELAGQRVRLSWPQTVTGFVLESTPALGTSAVWIPVEPPPSPANNEIAITIAASATTQFYRLRQL